MMLTRHHALPLLLMLAGTAACSPSDPDNPIPTPTPPLEISDAGVLRVPRAALDTPFILTTAAKTGDGVSDTDFYRSRVVSFVEATGGVSLVELASGALAPASSDRELWLLPTVSEDDTAIEVDFVAGADKVYIQPDLYDAANVFEEIVLPLTSSSLDSVADRDDTLIIRESVANSDAGIEAKVVYGLSPYSYDDGFDARQQTGSPVLYVGWPTGTPADKAERIFVLHHDVREPIVFHYTPNTPAERISDLQAAVDFWNGALDTTIGSQPLSLVLLSDDIDVMDPGVHVIKWLEDPAAGTGRGITQSDPYTGRTMKALVSVCSVFGLASDGETRAIVQLAQQAAAGTAAEPSAEQLERAKSAYFVNTYTHEVGHVLGLRHNFAGSLDGEVSAADVTKRTSDYLVDGVVPTDALSSSVMEYVSVPHVITTGARIAGGATPGPHDAAALQAAYGEGTATFSLFCEAEDESNWADCTQYDVGAKAAIGSYTSWEDGLKRAAFDVARTIADGGAPYPADIQALVLTDQLRALSERLRADAAFLSVAADVDPSDTMAFRAAMDAEQLAQYVALSGPNLPLVQALVQGGDLSMPVDALLASVQADVEATLAWLGITLDQNQQDQLNAWFDQVKTEVTTAVTALQAETHVTVL